MFFFSSENYLFHFHFYFCHQLHNVQSVFELCFMRIVFRLLWFDSSMDFSVSICIMIDFQLKHVARITRFLAFGQFHPNARVLINWNCVFRRKLLWFHWCGECHWYRFVSCIFFCGSFFWSNFRNLYARIIALGNAILRIMAGRKYNQVEWNLEPFFFVCFLILSVI